MIDPDNTHVCSGDATEAGCYCLEAEGKAELDIDVEEDESSEEELKTKPEHSVVELPVNFCKEDLVKVRID